MTQRHYGGPSVVYLGAGWALTARHVGHGEIMFDGEPIRPDLGSRHTLLNENGTAADAMVFELDPSSKWPDLPLLPIAKESPKLGDEVLMIGFGRSRGETFEVGSADGPTKLFRWTKGGRKAWGTNRVSAIPHWIFQRRYLTESFVTAFDPPEDETATIHEASAAEGDSGGAIFRKHEGEWELVGLMTSIGWPIKRPKEVTGFGDLTYSADLSKYRTEIFYWTRPECANEEDDDGDGLIDYPADPDCESPEDSNERTVSHAGSARWAWIVGLGLLIGMGFTVLALRRNQRIFNTPDSTSSSSAR